MAVRAVTGITGTSIVGKTESSGDLLTAGRPCRSVPAGFTLLELMLVMVLLSLSVSLFLGIQFQQRDNLRLRNSARRLFTFFQAARSQALLANRDNDCWYQTASRQVVETIKRRHLALPEKVFLLSESTSGTSEEVPEKIHLARFYADGTVSGDLLTLRSGKKSLILSFDPLLGTMHLSPVLDAADVEQ